MSETARLVPEFTREDFETERPYEWLYALQKTNKFVFMQGVNTLTKRAAEVGFTAAMFKRYLKAYIESVKPTVTVMGANVTEFPDQPMTLQCGEYVCNGDGVRKLGHMGEEVVVLPHPVMPVTRIVDLDTGAQKIQLAYSRRPGEWKTVIVPRVTAASAQGVVSLASNGLAVNSENARDVVRYLSDIESLNYDQLEERKSTSHLGWLSKDRFAPYVDDVVFDGDSDEFTALYDGMSPHGDPDVWFDLARTVRSGQSVPARIALAAAFAGPLVKPLGALSFFVHLWGLQGSGKTVALMLGASVWGNPAMGQLVKSFSGTKVSHELFSAFCCNVPVFLDELQVIADRQSFDDIIYALCEGVSKGRGAKGGGLQKQKQWATCFVTTGEMPIVKGNSGGGATVRTIEVNYAGEPFFQDARHVAAVVQENYGHAGRLFVEAIMQNMDKVRDWQKEYYAELSGTIQDKQVLAASVLLAADRLATEVLFRDGNGLTVTDVRPYLVTKDEADQNRRCYYWLFNYLGANPSRFDTSQNGELWGVMEDGAYYVNRAVFDKIVEGNGYSSKAFLTWAKRNGAIVADDYGVGDKNNRLTKRKRINGSYVTCVALKPPEDEPKKPVKWEEADNEELPF